jgi:hypothetical protein
LVASWQNLIKKKRNDGKGEFNYDIRPFDQDTKLQTILQSNNNKNSMVLAQKQT